MAENDSAPLLDPVLDPAAPRSVDPLVYWRNADLTERGVLSGSFGALQRRTSEIFKPPFEWPHVFRVTVTIPPQQAVNGASPGPMLNLSVPKGGLLK